MKVLCINTNGLLNDGITNSILAYYANMDKSDMDICLLQTATIANGVREKVCEIGLKLICVGERKNVLDYVISVAKLVKEEHYDIVHVHGSSALLLIDLFAAWLGGCKVRIAHSRNTQCNYKVLDRLLRPVFTLLCTNRFACGVDAGKWLFGKRPFEVIRNGKDIKKFRFIQEFREAIRKENGWENNILIGHVGNFNYQKNHAFLIDVFNSLLVEMPDAKLVLMGSGRDEYVKPIIEKVNNLQLQDKVVFLGSINNVFQMLNAMDIMLLPSRFEGLPNVVLEWQLSGLPSIISNEITRECGITKLVKYLPIDQGVECWKEAILEEVYDCQDRELASKEACDILSKSGYDICEEAKRLKEIYENLIRKR